MASFLRFTLRRRSARRRRARPLPTASAPAGSPRRAAPSPGPRKPAVPARLRRRQTDRLEPRERAAVLSQQLRSEPIALGVQSLESGAIGLKALRLAIGREAPDQREIAPLSNPAAFLNALRAVANSIACIRTALSVGNRSAASSVRACQCCSSPASPELMDAEARLEDAYAAARLGANADRVKSEQWDWIKRYGPDCGLPMRARPSPELIDSAASCVSVARWRSWTTSSLAISKTVCLPPRGWKRSWPPSWTAARSGRSAVASISPN